MHHWSDDVKPLIDHIGQVVRDEGFGFHTNEMMVTMHEAQPDIAFANEAFRSYQPSLTRHFHLSADDADLISHKSRHARFDALIRDEEQPTMMTSPTQTSFPPNVIPPTAPSLASAASATDPLQQRPMRPGFAPGQPGGIRPQRQPSGSSLFIQRPMMRKPSDGMPRPSFLRPSGPARFQRPPGAAHPAHPPPPPPGMGASGGRPPPRPPIAAHAAAQTATAAVADTQAGAATAQGDVPRGFVKRSRVQMLDFTDATILQENNIKAIEEGEKQKQHEKDVIKQQKEKERKQAQEERLRRQLEKKKEKEERDAKRRKSSVKTADTAAAAAAASAAAESAAATTSTSSSSPDVIPADAGSSVHDLTGSSSPVTLSPISQQPMEASLSVFPVNDGPYQQPQPQPQPQHHHQHPPQMQHHHQLPPQQMHQQQQWHYQQQNSISSINITSSISSIVRLTSIDRHMTPTTRHRRLS
ncbi:hypothetical protein BC940DRAFT_54764 [Gongronella butleri]|nr:hypothetical protein BC940DRAFT_54764 [Gongronella butleri]